MTGAIIERKTKIPGIYSEEMTLESGSLGTAKQVQHSSG